ncbi:MAG: phosphatidylserine decarboxylase [Bauldia sp.]
MDAIVNSIRTTLTPVRHEGLPFIAILFFVAVFFGWFWQPVFWIGIILAAWCAYFFRDPPRVTPVDPDLVVSPADGRVLAVEVTTPPAELGLGEQSRRRVSIFMSLFDCHVNRAPLAGLVRQIVYNPGKFLNADLDKASEDNERNALVLETGHGPVAVVQIAGLLARRIVCFAKQGDELVAGQRIGLIRFGSRLDVYLPMTATVIVAEGQIAIAGETVIARFGPEAAETRVRVD